MKNSKLVFAALAAIATVASPAFAKHHSNTLKKIGNAIQYSTRKDASNLSVDVHRGLGHKSVVHRHYGNVHRNAVVTPGGHIKPVHPMMMRNTSTRKYYMYHGHQWYVNRTTGRRTEM